MISVYATGLFDKLDEFMLEFQEHDQVITAGVAAYGKAAAYADVWEWGNIRQTKPGPKTVLGINPDGETVWLSAQAPFGYIKINTPHFYEALKLELSKVKFKGTNPREITEELEKAANNAMKLCAELLEDAAPVRSGQLSKSFRVVKAGDPMLDDSDDNRLLKLGMEEE